MFRILVSALCVIWCSASTQAQPSNQAQQDQERFKTAITASPVAMGLDGARLSGDGGAWLTAQAATADILLIGEMHGVADIAFTASALARAQGATVYGAEVGPTAAWALNGLLRAKGTALDEYMAGARRASSFAFLNMREEVVFARTVMQSDNGAKTDMWGLDQEFITSGPLMLDRLDALARTAMQKQAVTNARNAFAPFFALGKVPPNVFPILKSAFAQGPVEAKILIEDMALSDQIYAAPGYVQNAPREELMKRKFLMHWRGAKDSKGRTPKIVMKFGANHLQAGLSTTMVPALGGLVRNLALMEDKTVFSVLILCGPDGQQRRFDASVESCQAEFNSAAAALDPHLRTDGATVFNTAPLRLIPGTLKRLNFGEDLRQYIFSYDAIVVLKDAKPATHFSPPDKAWFSN